VGSRFVEGARLVTVQGPPGVGKTRCALQFARTSAIHGIDAEPLFVALAETSNEAEVTTALAQALDVPLAGGSSLSSRLQRALTVRSGGLIVLDNTEQLVDSLPELLSFWMSAAPQLRWLATSQRSLSMKEEQVVVLSCLTDSEAKSLFEQRARAHGMRRERMDADLVESICGRVESLPLALELAAARASALGLAALDLALEKNLSLLSRRAWDGEDRHATLHAAISWSCSLLGSAPRRTLAGLCVFRGGFSRSAVESVIDCGDVDTAFDELVDASLVVQENGGSETDGGVRYRLTSSVRDFAATALAEYVDVGVAERHARWCLSLVTQIGGQMWSTTSREQADLLMTELPNLLAGHNFLLGTAPLKALELAVAMEPVLRVRASIQQNSSLLARSLDAASDSAPERVRASALAALAGTYSLLGDREAATLAIQQATSLAEASGDPATRAWVLARDGLLGIRMGEGARSEEILLQARLLSQEAQEEGLEAEVCAVLGILRENQGRLEEAEEVLLVALELGRSSGHERATAAALGNLAIVASRRGLPKEASALRSDAIEVYRRIDSKLHLAAMLINQGVAAVEAGQCEEAVPRCREAIAACRKLGDADGEAIATSNLALAQWELGDHESGEQGFHSAIEQFTPLGRPREQGFSHLGLALVYQVRGELEAASTQLQEAIGLFHRHGDLLAEALATCLRAVVWFEQGEQNRALAILNGVLEESELLSDALVRALRSALRVLEDSGVPDLAESHYERVVAAALSAFLTRT
jgi:predicted ATPase